jgi:hypothetical protein
MACRNCGGNHDDVHELVHALLRTLEDKEASPRDGFFACATVVYSMLQDGSLDHAPEHIKPAAEQFIAALRVGEGTAH